jgi:hypothetical protein
MFGAETTWPEAIIFLGILLAAMLLIGIAVSAFLELRKTKLLAAQEDNLRQLVRRYEQLTETTLDAQQRVAAGPYPATGGFGQDLRVEGLVAGRQGAARRWPSRRAAAWRRSKSATVRFQAARRR